MKLRLLSGSAASPSLLPRLADPLRGREHYGHRSQRGFSFPQRYVAEHLVGGLLVVKKNTLSSETGRCAHFAAVSLAAGTRGWTS